MRPPALAVFVKGARPGRVKTRLAPPLTPGQACAVHQAFAEDVVTLVSDLAVERFVFTDDTDDPFVKDLARRADVPLRQQHPGDLGQRMLEALAELAPDRPGALIVGSDSPTLPLAFLRDAVERVSEGLVIGPAVDGGYYLIGAPRPVPELFEAMPWSSAQVLAETLNRVSSLGHPLHLLPFWYDVDTAEELALLRAHLATLPPGIAPSTRALLETIPDPARSRKLTPPDVPR